MESVQVKYKPSLAFLLFLYMFAIALDLYIHKISRLHGMYVQVLCIYIQCLRAAGQKVRVHVSGKLQVSIL